MAYDIPGYEEQGGPSFETAKAKILAEADEKRRSKTFQVTGTSACRTCQPYEGKVFSEPPAEGLPGPEVLAGGLFHANCQHSVEPVEGEVQPASGKAALTQDELYHLQRYQIGSADVNDALRAGGKNLSAEQQDVVRFIDSAMPKGIDLQPGTVLYRGIRRGEYAKLERAALNGKVYTDRGFMSTTTSEKIADDFMQYAGSGGKKIVIEVPRGSKAIPMDEWLKDLECAEMLLPRGTKFTARFAANRVDIILTVQ